MMATIYRFEEGKPIRYSVLQLMWHEFRAIWLGFFGSLILIGVLAWVYFG